MSTHTGPRLEIHTQPGIERKKDIKIGSQKFELVALAQLTEYFQTFLKLNFFLQFNQHLLYMSSNSNTVSIQFNDL